MSRRGAFDYLCKCLNPVAGQIQESELHAVLTSPDFSWEELVMTASEHKVSAMVNGAIKSYNLASLMPSDLVDYFEGMEELARQRNKQILTQALEISSLLNGIGVTPVFLKGAAALVSNLYADISHRVMLDIDVLVPNDLLFDCVAVLKNHGYAEADEDIVADPRSHHYPPLDCPGRVAPVELHSELVAFPNSELLTESEVYAEAQFFEINGAKLAVPSAHHQIIHTIAHAQVTDQHYLHGFIIIRQFLECLYLQRKTSGDLNWSDIETKFVQAGLALPYACQMASINQMFGAGWSEPTSYQRRAKLFHQRALFQIGFPRAATQISRILNPIALLHRSLADRQLRGRLLRNMFKPSWLKRHWVRLIGK